MSFNNELINSSNNEMGLNNIKVSYVEQVGDYLFLALDNNQRVLTNGSEIYDISNYDHISDLFNMKDRLCAVLRKGFTFYVVDLKSNEVLFKDDNAYNVSKQDDRVLYIIKRIGNNSIYDIETKKYIESPENYKFDKSLGNNLYVFKEDNSDYSNSKRCIIDADGRTIIKDIDGLINLYESYLIIEKSNELCIINIANTGSLIINTIEKKEEFLAKPEYFDGHIILMEKGFIKIYTLDLKIVKQIEIEELESIIDYEMPSDVLKLALPYSIDGGRIDRQLFVNLKTGKYISHIRIEGYPYWNPNVFVGKDNINDELIDEFEYGETYEQTEYYFYDYDFNKIVSVKGNFNTEIEDDIFVIETWNGKNFERKYINTKTKTIKDCNYDVIKFSPNTKNALAHNTLTDMFDIVDKDLCVVIPNINYKKFGLKLSRYSSNTNYFVVNSYVCIIKHIPEGSASFYRYIIQNANGEIKLDSTKHRCYPVGNMIQIIKDGESDFLNTLTGEIGKLSLNVPTNEEGKIDLDKINDVNNIFQIENTNQLLLSQDDDQPKEMKLTK